VLHGWIILDKPVGLGSTTAVSAIKRLLREAGEPKTKVGHGGTLDPLASGVLPIALGEATKLAGRMLGATKAYDFTIAFGTETDTLDGEGQVIATSNVRPTMADVAAVLGRFTGPISQIPPAFSALKIDGQRAYDRARAGETVAITARDVTVHSLAIRHPELDSGSISPPLQPNQEWMLKQVQHDELNVVALSATVSKGTYIRSLARDIARALGTVGHVAMLRRTRAGPFTLTEAKTLDFLDGAAKARTLDGAVLPLQAALDDIPALPVTPDQARLLRHGQMLFGFPASPGLALAMDGDVPVALVEQSGDGLKVVRGFNL